MSSPLRPSRSSKQAAMPTHIGVSTNRGDSFCRKAGNFVNVEENVQGEDAGVRPGVDDASI